MEVNGHHGRGGYHCQDRSCCQQRTSCLGGRQAAGDGGQARASQDKDSYQQLSEVCAQAGGQPNQTSPPVWQHKTSEFDPRTIQQLLETHMVGVKKEMEERQAGLINLLRQEMRQVWVEQSHLLGVGGVARGPHPSL